MSTAGAMLFCAHQALLGTPQDPDLLELLAAQAACPCGTPVVRRGALQLAISPPTAASPGAATLAERILDDWDAGISLAGALLRAAAELDPDTPAMTALAASQEQVAALAWRTPIRYTALGAGRYSVSADPIAVHGQPSHPIAGRTPNEEQAPADSVLLLDPCGPVLTPLRDPVPLHTEMPR